MKKLYRTINWKMNKLSFQSEFLKNLFNKFHERKIKYCILRNYEGLPEKMTSSDVDILVDKRNLVKAIKITK